MIASLMLLLKFVWDVVRRLIHDAYYRALATVLLIIVLVGTLFFWLVEGRTFMQALAYSSATMAMNSPYGIEWGPKTIGGVIFNIIYLFLSVGIFLLFVLETGKTLVRSHEQFLRKRAERQALKRAGRPGSRP